MVGDPGIEPGVRLREGVTVPCHTLRPVAHEGPAMPNPGREISPRRQAVNRKTWGRRVGRAGLAFRNARSQKDRTHVRGRPVKKPAWVIEKERAKKAETVWLFGLHAVRDALVNPRRTKLRLVLTKNAADRLADVLPAAGIEPEIADPRAFPAPLDPGSVHQGAALEVKPLDWGNVADRLLGPKGVVICLDRVTDPHNVGAILRSAEVFGASAVIAPARHAAPETGALAKTASGALERQPYIRVRNLSAALDELKAAGVFTIGLDGEADADLPEALARHADRPVALVLGAEGPGLRDKTKATCDILARIPSSGAFGSLNVSNAAAVALYAAQRR